MKQNFQKTIQLIPLTVLSDIFLKNLNPQQFLIKEMEKEIELLFKSWRENTSLDKKDESIFGNKEEDFKTSRIAFNINFGYKKGQLDLIGDKTYEYFDWDGNMLDIAEKYLFLSRNSKNLLQVPMQLQILDFDKYDRDIRFKELIAEYPFFQYYPDIPQKESFINASKMRIDDAEAKISDFFQLKKYNHIDKFVINCDRQIGDFNFKFALHFWIVGPLDNSMNLVNEYFKCYNINNYTDFLLYRHGLK
jgi:hypothetical protein